MRRDGMILAVLFVVLAPIVIAHVACGDDGEREPATVCEKPAMTATDSTAGPPAVSGETVTTDSGLQYIDIVEGSGVMPVQGQIVTVHYTGWLTDGTKFDSSLGKERPFTFSVGLTPPQPTAGWDEGVATMRVCGQRRLIMPPELAYGEEGVGSLIPPNATLILDLELLEVR